MALKNDIKKTLLSEKEIKEICKKLGKQITKDYKKENDLLLLGLLKGCHPFISDLAREIDLPLEITYMDASSYEGTKSTGTVKINYDADINVNNRNVLIVEDIVDTGLTLQKVINLLKARSPKSIKIVSLLNKPCNRIKELKIDYIGKEIPNEFAVGYGLDYNQKYRNLNFIGVLKEEIYSK